MATTRSVDLLALFRQGARDLLGIPEDASETEVRRRCLGRLEDEDFRPDDDVSAAIQVLCGEALGAGTMPRNAPALGLRVERLVRRELEEIALRLRSEKQAASPAESVRTELEAIRDAAELFPSTELWHRRLKNLSATAVPPPLTNPEQARLVEALLEVVTTWPGAAGEVRRRHLAAMPRDRFAPAAKALRKRWPKLTAVDPFLIEAVIPVTFKPRPGQSKPGLPTQPVQPSSLGRGIILAGSIAVFVVIGMFGFGMALVAWDQWMIGRDSIWSARPQRTIREVRTRPRQPTSPPVRRPAAPMPVQPVFPSGFTRFGTAIYAPWNAPTVPGLAPGETVRLISVEGDRPLFIVPGTKKGYRVPKRDILHANTAFSDLHFRTAEHPGDGLAWVAFANVAISCKDETTARRCYEQATRLGIHLATKTVDGKSFWIPVSEPEEESPPLVPPPPPLPMLVGEEAP